MPDSHNFQPVNVPPHFTCSCYKCGKRMDSAHEIIWADLNGPAFHAYYCDSCKAQTEDK